ncbi:alpha/beta hydrolase [Streptosporangium sp. NPDC023615]|uniref:alpha/beta fold hydrolase n=1 Tax=Streptosporangium sp. NPDC023615 TaxID=3154794 RepID=UPI003431A212
MNGLRVIESGTGPAVLWVHGYTMDSTLWRPLWELLPGWRHLGVDLPGHGGSEPLRRGQTLPALALRLAAFAEAEGAHRVVGLSFGSSVTLQMALEAPGVVRNLVLAAPTLGGAPPDPAARRRYLELMTLRRARGAPEQMAELWMDSPPDIFRGTEARPALRARLREVIGRHSWAELDTGAMAMLGMHRHPPEDLARVRARTTVIVGDSDMPAFTANAETLRRNVPGCEVRVIPDSAHLPLLERPEIASAAVFQGLSLPEMVGKVS